ncbi:hypothetical protein [Limnoglobus roseus]|uniref:Uncharacterized protein n=1 Tax=Limnoglobus roseus TaxID=2598579 RepID=A0A5C1AA97_9BACT|nr:hypothetical protein [Limnoglobus roseus]QEL15137.1 hypothetical protein PX52LOC_02046 [Limnoglobus roseus]
MLCVRGSLKFRPCDQVEEVRRAFVHRLNRRHRAGDDCSVFAVMHPTRPERVHYDYIAITTNPSVRAARRLLRACWCGRTNRPFSMVPFVAVDGDAFHAVRNYLEYLTKLRPRHRQPGWYLPLLGRGQRLTMKSGPWFVALRIGADGSFQT